MEMSESAAIERVNDVLNPQFLGELRMSLARMLGGFRDREQFYGFLYDPIPSLERAGTPGFHQLPGQTKDFVRDTLRQSNIEFPANPKPDPKEIERALARVLCVLVILICVAAALVAIGFIIAIGVQTVSAIVVPLNAALAAIGIFLTGLTAAQVTQLLTGLVVVGMVIGVVVIGVSVAFCHYVFVP